MSHEEKDESTLALANVSQSPNGQQSNRRDGLQLNTKRRQLLNTQQSNTTNSFPGTSRVNVIHNQLNTKEDRQRLTSMSSLDVSLSSPEGSPHTQMYNIQPSNRRSYLMCNKDDGDGDVDINTDDDEDEQEVDVKPMNKSQDSDDNIEVDDGFFRVAGFIDDDSDDLEINSNFLKACFKRSQLLRPFVDLYSIPTLNRRDITMLMLESYNSWFKGFKLRNVTEQDHHVDDPMSPPLKQSFANRMKGNYAATPPKANEKESYVQLIDSDLSSSKSVRDDISDNSSTIISSPASEKDEEIYNKSQDFPDLYTKTKAAAKELRTSQPSALSSYNNKSNINTKESRSNQSPSASNIVELKTGEKCNPNTGSWSNNNRRGRQKPNNDLNRSNDQQRVDVKIKCPICTQNFSADIVERHAASCIQFPMETRSNNQDKTSNIKVSSSNNAPSTSVDLTSSDEDGNGGEWETVKGKSNKRKGDEEDLKGTDNVKRACRTKH